MRIYWYWPFAREEDIALALATPGPDDTLTVSALDRPGAPFLRTERVTALPELPEVRPVREGSISWILSRAHTYQARARVRSRRVAGGGFDVCHVAFVNQYTDIVGLSRIARRTNLVTTVHDVLPHRSRMPSGIQHQALAMLYRVAGTIVVHHQDVGAELMARFDVDPARVHVVPHWVSPFRDAGDRRTLSAAHRVLFFGTLRGNKGVEVLLDAVARLGPETGVQFHIAGRGDDDLERAVVAAAERCPNLTAEVGWITPERKAELFRAADLAVLPYTAFSSTSGVLHDAFGNHLPAVASDVGALRAGIEETGAGWVVPPGSASELAAAIDAAFRDAEAWQRAADGAREIAIRQAPERVGAALREVYRQAVDAGR
ncbi:MAG TPA: glycosyltransferase family 4 protein [Acidimicrobiia bacterium]|jgi:glycosyltransferase involved in cell wall biosynthesis